MHHENCPTPDNITSNPWISAMIRAIRQCTFAISLTDAHELAFGFVSATDIRVIQSPDDLVKFSYFLQLVSDKEIVYQNDKVLFSARAFRMLRREE